MSHEIYGDRFFGGNAEVRKHHWHKIGNVVEQNTTATEAWNGYMRPWGIEKLPSYVEFNGATYPTGKFNICRVPLEGTTDLDTLYPVAFGEVSDRYVVIQPQTIVEVLDRVTGGRAVNTMGALRGGRDFFASYAMKEYAVKDSSIRPYAMVHSPYSGAGALVVKNTGVCPVCQNTVNAALKDSGLRLSIKHDENIEARFEKFMAGFLVLMEQKTEVQKGVFNAMANRKLKPSEVDKLIAAIYPMPKKIGKTGLGIEEAQALDAKRAKMDGYREAMTLKQREIVRRLFEGEGTGADLVANKGTAYGLLNAVAEEKDWTGAALKDGEEGRNTIADAMFGIVAKEKEDAYTLIKNFVKA